MFERLYNAFGPQHWWPGDGPFEIAVGAILTQNTNWDNVKKAITNLRKARILSARSIDCIEQDRLAELIRPSGYYNMKAVRIKSFVTFLMREYKGSMKRMGRDEKGSIREKLLAVKGIGPETADSIILYALGMPVFVIDAYTKRILSRHGILDYDEPYERFQDFFYASLKIDVWLYNEYHALLVMAGKTYCRSAKPLCESCPLGDV